MLRGRSSTGEVLEGGTCVHSEYGNDAYISDSLPSDSGPVTLRLHFWREGGESIADRCGLRTSGR